MIPINDQFTSYQIYIGDDTKQKTISKDTMQITLKNDKIKNIQEFL